MQKGNKMIIDMINEKLQQSISKKQEVLNKDNSSLLIKNNVKQEDNISINSKINDNISFKENIETKMNKNDNSLSNEIDNIMDDIVSDL